MVHKDNESAAIARALIDLRKRRNLKQRELAALVGTGQTAISRIERADYGSWTYSFLRRVAHVLRARVRVIIEPIEGDDK